MIHLFRENTHYHLATIELLKYLGLSFRVWEQAAWRNDPPPGITLILRQNAIDPLLRQQLDDYCRGGNVVLSIACTRDLDDLLGIETQSNVEEGWIRWGEHPLTEGFRSSFHFFDAVGVKPLPHTFSCGTILDKAGEIDAAAALTCHPVGEGCAALIAFDLIRTVVHMQHGDHVRQDGTPSPDGSAPIDDGILKSEDGFVLDWVKDRQAVGDGLPFFLHPIADEMKVLFIRTIHQLYTRCNRPFGMLWFWPNGISSIGHISHDSDGNDASAAMKLLEYLKQAELRSTWCVICPGYESRIYESILTDGHEIAFHFDALGEQSGCEWSNKHFVDQLSNIGSQIQELTDAAIVTNKNHYLRWEGKTEFYEWCEEAGIRIEQSKGGTKLGNKGFLFGTCHPYRPVKQEEIPRILNVWSVPTAAWDPPRPYRCTLEEAKALIGSSASVHGIAHFLVHPELLKESEDLGKVMVELAEYGLQMGLEWWTARELYHWLSAKEQAEVRFEQEPNDRYVLHFKTSAPLEGMTILTSLPFQEANIVRKSHIEVRRIKKTQKLGLELWQIEVDVLSTAGTLVIACGDGQ